MTDEIRNGRDLYNVTDDKFDYWFVDAYGIHANGVINFADLSIDEAREVRDELDEVIEFCEGLETPFPDIHD